MFSDDHDRILIDGFFSRPGPLASIVRLQSDPAQVRAGLGDSALPLRAVLTAHAHHDHALDNATVAREAPEAVVIGTPSVVRLMERQGVEEDRLRAPTDGEDLVFGPFRVRAFYVDHGPSPRLLRWLLDRPLAETGGTPGWFGGYDDDRNLSFLIVHGERRILVHPSSGTRDLRPLRPDTVFLGVGRLGKMKEEDARTYVSSVIGQATRLIVPIHWMPSPHLLASL